MRWPCPERTEHNKRERTPVKKIQKLPELPLAAASRRLHEEARARAKKLRERQERLMAQVKKAKVKAKARKAKKIQKLLKRAA
jgi:hypothetical protein